MSDRSQSSFVEYGVEDRPPLPTSVLLGVQHYLTMVGANIAVPLILAGALGMPDALVPRFVGTFFVVSGVATLAQTTFGNRYPIVQGAPFSMFAPALAVVAVARTTPAGVPWQSALLQLQGAILVAALAEVAVGYFGLLGRLRRFISPVVIAPTIALIGLSLFDTPQVTAATGNWWLLGLTVVLIVLFSQYLDAAIRVFRLFPVLLGVVAAYLVAVGLSVAGVFAPDTPGYVDVGAVLAAPAFMPIHPFQWAMAGGPNTVQVTVPLLGVPLAFGLPQFTLSFVVGMLAGVVASMIESFGDYHAVARLSGVGAPSERRINHGIGMEGLMNAFAATMGAAGSTSYSENIGAIGITGVASRYVVQVGAAVMLVVGFVGYFGQLVATIPDPIVGGLFLAMFGQIVAVGLAQLEYVDLDSSRNVFVVGFALFVGLAVPAYMGNVAAANPDVSGAEAFRQGLRGVAFFGPVLGTKLVADVVYVIGSTGMAVGGLVAFLLDNSIDGTREERGIEEWERHAETDEDFASAYDRFVRDDDASRAD